MFKKIMKKVVFFSGALLIAGLATHFVTERAVYAFQSNPIQQDSNASSNAEYLWVFNEDTETHEVGDVVVFVSTPSTNGTRGLSISTTTTESDAAIAGVVVEKDIPTLSWGKIQTRGYNAAVNVTGTCIVGGELITSSTAETAVSSNTVASSIHVAGVFGVTLTADSDGACPSILR